MTYKKIRIGSKTFQLSRIIMENHLGRKLDRKEVVHHIDGNKKNNDISNLKVETLSEHTRHHATGRDSAFRGEKNKNSKLKNEDIPKIRLLLQTKSERYVAAEFNVCRNTIRKIKNNIDWKYF